MPHALIRPFSDRATFTVAHVVADAATRRGDDDSRGLDAFIGDTLLMPDHGSARCDFPSGDAAQLYRSVRRPLAPPPETRLNLCHDHPPAEANGVRYLKIPMNAA